MYDKIGIAVSEATGSTDMKCGERRISVCKKSVKILNQQNIGLWKTCETNQLPAKFY